LGILPTGTILPPAHRAIRDLARRRLQLVRSRTSHILLETGPIDRFAEVGNYASYARCVDSQRISNGTKKGEGNAKNGNKYLAWAFVEAANFALRFCAEAKRFYERKRAKGLAPNPAAMNLCKSIGHEAAPTFFWGGHAARAKAEHLRSLDPDG
jgi:transposase